MATTHFASMPNVSLPRTKMGVNFTHPMSFNHGEIVPVFHTFVQPGDSFKLDLSMLLRMSTPIFPIFGDIDLYAHSFFVPMRLLWDHTPEFYGENKVNAGPQTVEYKIPSGPCYYGASGSCVGPAIGSVSHHLGMPAMCKNQSREVINDYPSISNVAWAALKDDYNVLPERGYWLIVNEYYRAQQVQAPVQVYTGDLGAIFVSDITTVGDTVTVTPSWWKACEITNKKLDYYTSATISPQYSADPVSIPLGDYAPLKLTADGSAYEVLDPSEDGNEVIFGGRVPADSEDAASPLYNDNSGYLGIGKEGQDLYVSDTLIDRLTGGIKGSPAPTDDTIMRTNLVADLSNAVAANVNQIRLAFATQRFLERDNFGTRYPEIIKSHFGVTSSLSILQRPQLLYKGSTSINIQQVLSTADATTTSGTKLGQPGANSVTAFKCPIVHNAFDEFGYLYVLIETKHNRVYSQGINRFRTKKTKFDYYFPEFATIGDQEVKARELMAMPFGNDSGTWLTFAANDIYGYQEAWAEYRYFPDVVSGKLDPATESGFGYMTLAENFKDVTSKGNLLLSRTFLKENRDNLARCLTTGDSGPDYVGDFAITGNMIRTMPLYSIPGLVDHVGAR